MNRPIDTVIGNYSFSIELISSIGSVKFAVCSRGGVAVKAKKVFKFSIIFGRCLKDMR